MQGLVRPWGLMTYQIDGPLDAPTVVFASSLGTDLRLWDPVLPLLPGLRLIRYDKRGHGLSDLGGSFDIHDLAEDLAALIRALAPSGAVVVGLSIGGAIAQAVAARHPDLVRALVLSNTAARFGTPEAWQARSAAVEAGGMAAIAEAVLQRWFPEDFRAAPEIALWRNMLLRCDPQGYIACCKVLAGCDLTASTAALTVPTLAIGGSEDEATPPDVVRATAELIRGASFHLLLGTGHLPVVDAPQAWAEQVLPFLKGHAK